MYDVAEIKRIKNERRRKQLGVKFDLDVDFKSYSTATEASLESDEDGHEFEPFNMKQEMAEGRVDDQGNYTMTNRAFTSDNREFMRDKQGDAWLESVEKDQLASTKKSSSFYRKQPKRIKQDEDDVFISLEKVPTIDLIKALIYKLRYGETPIEALRRLNKKESSNAARKESGGTDKESDGKIVNQGVPWSLGVSELVHAVTMIWQNIYYMTREEIVEALSKYKLKGKQGRLLEFKWVKGDDKVYGPNTQEELLQWIAMDYISDNNPILVRQVINGKPVSEEFVDIKESFIYTEFDLQNRREIETVTNAGFEHSKDGNDSNENEEDDEDTFASKRRKTNLIGIKNKQRRFSASDNESDDD